MIPFFAFPPQVRRVIYTTNVIESLHMQLPKIIKTRGHFPSDEAATKLLWLALRSILAGKDKIDPGVEGGHESVCRDVRRSIHEHRCVNPASHTELMTGSITLNWKRPPPAWQAAKSQLSIQFGGRFVFND